MENEKIKDTEEGQYEVCLGVGFIGSREIHLER